MNCSGNLGLLLESALVESSLILVLVVAAFCTGVSKAGFSGVSYISVFLLAETFGARESIGIALPMLVMADLVVYPSFREYGNWRSVWQFMWPALIGLALAFVVLQRFSNDSMRMVIGRIIISMVAMQSLRKWFPAGFKRVAHSTSFSVVAGVSGGIATALANAAGPIMQLFLLSREVPKLDMMGVSARFFLVINLIKLPMTASLQLTTWETLRWNLAVLPLIVLGIWLGKKVLHRVPQKAFEVLVVGFALVAGLKLLLS